MVSDTSNASEASNDSGVSDIADVYDASGVSGVRESLLILINTGDTAVTRQLPDEAAEYRKLSGALYTGEERAVQKGTEVTIPAGSILFLQK